MIAQNRAGVNISKVEIGVFSQLFVENSLNYRLWGDLACRMGNCLRARTLTFAYISHCLRATLRVQAAAGTLPRPSVLTFGVKTLHAP